MLCVAAMEVCLPVSSLLSAPEYSQELLSGFRFLKPYLSPGLFPT